MQTTTPSRDETDDDRSPLDSTDGANTDETDDGPDEAVEGAGRAGFFVRGLVYAISAALTTRIALGDYGTSGQEEGPGKRGALETVAEQPFGRILVLAMGLGLAGYAVWRLDRARRRLVEDQKWHSVVANVFRGLVYLAGAGIAGSLVLGGSDDGGGSSGGSGGGDRLFDLPGGALLVGAVGVGFLIAAVYNAWRALADHPEWRDDLTGIRRGTLDVVAAAGLVGHMVVLGTIGWFVTSEAWNHDPDATGGLDQAVRSVVDESYGPPLLLGLAGAMLAYAALSIAEALWRALDE